MKSHSSLTVTPWKQNCRRDHFPVAASLPVLIPEYPSHLVVPRYDLIRLVPEGFDITITGGEAREGRRVSLRD